MDFDASWSDQDRGDMLYIEGSASYQGGWMGSEQLAVFALLCECDDEEPVKIEYWIANTLDTAAFRIRLPIYGRYRRADAAALECRRYPRLVHLNLIQYLLFAFLM